MSNFDQFMSSPILRPPTSLVNARTVASNVPGELLSTISDVARVTLSGALTANTLKTMLTITGRGVLDIIGYGTVDATARTVRVQITIDGTVVANVTSGSIATANTGGILIGAVIGNNTIPSFVFGRIPFNVSCLVEIASSLTETDKVRFYDAYQLVT